LKGQSPCVFLQFLTRGQPNEVTEDNDKWRRNRQGDDFGSIIGHPQKADVIQAVPLRCAAHFSLEFTEQSRATHIDDYLRKQSGKEATRVVYSVELDYFLLLWVMFA
jgi:hypothetical protein